MKEKINGSNWLTGRGEHQGEGGANEKQFIFPTKQAAVFLRVWVSASVLGSANALH
jgi:hypothetical protein